MNNLINPITFITEQWKPITEFIVPYINPYYAINIYGEIYSSYSNSYLSTFNDKGYIRVGLMTKYGQKNISVHRLVMLAFVYVPNHYELEINHIDGNKTNNHISNLEWTTTSQNIQHAYNIGIHPKGENFYRSRLSNQEVIFICEELSKGIQIEEIAKSVDLDNWQEIRKLIYSIKDRMSWKHISNKYIFPEYKSNVQYKFTDEEIHIICKCFEKNMVSKDILQILGYDIDNMDIDTKNTYITIISSIRNNKIYKDISKDYNFSRQRNRCVFSIEQLHQICSFLEKDISYNDILINLGFNLDELDSHVVGTLKTTLSSIKHRKNFKNISKDYNF